MNRNLTQGKPWTVLWQFCLPLLGSILFQQLYNLADSWVAGKFISQDALAAVGNSYEITLLFLAFAFGCNIGCSVVVSQLFGARQYGQMKTAVSTAMIASGLVCLLLMVVGVAGCEQLLHLIQTPETVFADSMLYLDIYIWGLPFVFFYNIATGIFSALGDSRTPFLFLAVSSLANIAMDILFVTAFSMGVAGVAWATFLCQGVSCILAVGALILRLRSIQDAPADGFFSLPLLKRFVVIALPSVLQQSFISVGNIVIQGMINGFGTEIMAGYSAGVKLNNLVITSFSTMGNGVSNYAAQNFGAGLIDRLKEGYRAAIKLIWLVCLPLALVYFLLPETLMRLFVEDPTPLALSTGGQYLRILSPFYFLVSAKLVTDGILRGAGQMNSFMIATFTDLFLRVTLAYILSSTALGATGIWCAWPIGWTVAFLISLFLYHRHFHTKLAGKPSPCP